MTSPARMPEGSPTIQSVAGARLRLSLSLTDVLFLLVMTTLVIGHLQRVSAGSLLSLLYVLQQVTVIIFTLLHRPHQGSRASWRDIFLAWGGTLLPLALQSNGQTPNAIGALLVLSGLVLSTGAVISLGRSFGIEAANRGIQTHGLYRFVRHPIYAAYLPLVIGYFIAYPSVANGSILVVWLMCQVARIYREESLLCLDSEYQLYVQRVRRRLIPAVW